MVKFLFTFSFVHLLRGQGGYPSCSPTIGEKIEREFKK